MIATQMTDLLETYKKGERIMNLKQEVESRKTFAIISHPDAGKTTLTENYYILVVQFVKQGQLKVKDWKICNE